MMPDNRSGASVRVESPARDYIRTRGSNLYIWADGGGLIHRSLEQPSFAQSEDWVTLDVDDVACHIGSSAAAATEWHVRLLRFPWRRLDVMSNMGGAGQIESGTTTL